MTESDRALLAELKKLSEITELTVPGYNANSWSARDVMRYLEAHPDEETQFGYLLTLWPHVTQHRSAREQ